MNPKLPLVLALLSLASSHAGEITFKKFVLTEEFVAEGAHFGDFDRDGSNDICAGPYIWKGPDFKQRVTYTAPAAKPYDPAKGYSDYFGMHSYDFNGDGWSDILVYSWPGKDTWVFENPQNKGGDWPRHTIFDVTDNESPDFVDVNGDGKPELLCHSGGQLGYGEIDWASPFGKARFRPITPKSPENDKKYFRYTHGYGAGDVNGDGRIDILDKEGWREQPVSTAQDQDWIFHPAPFTTPGARGGCFILVYDVNGDGRNDVINVHDSHGYGLSWFEQKPAGAFVEHKIMGSTPEESRHGVKFSQPHAMQLADVNGDGVLDLVVGKRRWAHGPAKDAEPAADPVLYWFEIKRDGKGGADFIPHLIDSDSGVGTQVTPGDVNRDGKVDVVVANKRGVFVFLQE